MEGNLHFKIDWASLIIRNKQFPSIQVSKGNFQVQAYTWRDLFSEFYGILNLANI